MADRIIHKLRLQLAIAKIRPAPDQTNRASQAKKGKSSYLIILQQFPCRINIGFGMLASEKFNTQSCISGMDL
jgi:hypothetical protein